jgi:predicted DNA-binding protein with PD1-like motif
MRAILSRALGCQQRNASTLGSHLLAATVRATLEVLLTDAPAHVSRQHDSQAD